MIAEQYSQGGDAPLGVEYIIAADGIARVVQSCVGGGHVVAALQGQLFEDILDAGDRALFALVRNWVVAGGTPAPTIKLRFLGNDNRWLTVNATIAKHSAESVRVSFVQVAPSEWCRIEAQMRKVVEGSLQGIVVRTGKRVLYMNDAFAKLRGFGSARELMTQNHSLGTNVGIHPDDIPLVAERVRRRTAGEEQVSHYEFRLLHLDGTIRWVDTLATLVEWDGQPASLSWMTDVTTRKEMENELVRCKEAAEFANRTKTQFLANMSHELRTPLNAIIGFSEVIMAQLFGPVGQPKYVDYANDIHQSGIHLLDLISDILDLAKLEAGKLELRESEIVISDVIERCLTLIRPRAEASSVELCLALPKQLPLLRADERAVKQVLLNFLSNAVKFTPPAGIVTLRAWIEAGRSVNISVTDTGIGMTPADIEIALAPFGQVDSTLARQHQGTGLGLPITRSLMELHGGHVPIESAPNIGTTITASFPIERVVLTSTAYSRVVHEIGSHVP